MAEGPFGLFSPPPIPAEVQRISYDNEQMPDKPASSASDYLAAERTFLAWIRTGLALMGFGFVVARFGLFLQALQIGQPNLPLEAPGLSPWFGTALILLGVIVNVWSTWSHIRLVRELKRGESEFARPSSLAISLAVALAALGLAMAIYLVSIR
jgi:putative membrane protein